MLLAHHPPHLRLGHLPVQAVRDDDVHVVDAVRVELLEQDLDDGLPDVREHHGRQRQRDVVDGDRDAHPRLELRVERVRAERVVERVADGGARVGQPLDGRLRVDDARPDRQVLEQEVLAREEDARRGVAVDVDDLVVFLVARHGAAENLGGSLSHDSYREIQEPASRAGARCCAGGCRG